MSLTGFIVLYAVIWFVTLWVVLPIGLETQGDRDDVVAGTPESAPSNLRLGRKFLLTTIFATLIWLPIVGSIAYFDVDIMRLDPYAWFGGDER